MEDEMYTNIEINENNPINKNELKVDNVWINGNRIIKNYGTTSNNIGINNKLPKKEKEKIVQKFIEQIAQKLDKEEIFVVDRFEGHIAVCENNTTRGNDKHSNNRITR